MWAGAERPPAPAASCVAMSTGAEQDAGLPEHGSVVPEAGGFDAVPEAGGFDAVPEAGGFDAVPEAGGFDAVPETGGFQVHLDNFDGPFDLLLQLISRHKLDITEVALSQVTDEFIAHIKAAGTAWDLDQTSQFVVVAATLLDLKAARLLPSGEVEDPEDLALLEARDLLFARLLQYRAFKEVSAYLAGTLEDQARRFPREVGLDA